MNQSPRAVVQRYFDAMQRGQAGQEDLLALFHEAAVYTEPFSGTPRTWTGLAEIRQRIEASWESSPPDLRLEVERVDVDGERVRALWTCDSPVFPAPMKGEDRYLIREGRIVELRVRFLESAGVS